MVTKLTMVMIYFLVCASFLGVGINITTSMDQVLKGSFTVIGVTDLRGSSNVENLFHIPHFQSTSAMLVHMEVTTTVFSRAFKGCGLKGGRDPDGMGGCFPLLGTPAHRQQRIWRLNSGGGFCERW